MFGSRTITGVRAVLVSVALLTAMGGTSSALSSEKGRKVYFGPQQVQEMILDHIEANMPWEPGNTRVEFLDRIDGITVAGDNIDYRVEARRNENYIGHTSFSIKFYDGGVLAGDHSFRVHIEVAKDFVVSARNLDDGTVLSDNDVVVVRRWVDRIPRGRIGDPEDVVGMMIKGSIAPNTELKPRMLREPRLVNRGDVVRVILSRGALYMETIGVSTEAGALGDRIKIKNTTSNNIFYARVVDEAVVFVDF